MEARLRPLIDILAESAIERLSQPETVSKSSGLSLPHSSRPEGRVGGDSRGGSARAGSNVTLRPAP